MTLLFFVDHNVSGRLAQLRELGLRKGAYFNSTFAVTALLNAVMPSFGLPFVTASLPHSPQFVEALTTYATRGDAAKPRGVSSASSASTSSSVVDDGGGLGLGAVEWDTAASDVDANPPATVSMNATDGGGVTTSRADSETSDLLPVTSPVARGPAVVGVTESRVAPLAMYLMMAGALMLPHLLRTIPSGVVDGILAFVGLHGILGGNNALVRRVRVLLSDGSYTTTGSGASDSEAYLALPRRVINRFTLIQLGLLALCWAVTLSPWGLAFPLVIVSIIPFRLRMMTRWFSARELQLLDNEIVVPPATVGGVEAAAAAAKADRVSPAAASGRWGISDSCPLKLH